MLINTTCWFRLRPQCSLSSDWGQMLLLLAWITKCLFGCVCFQHVVTASLNHKVFIWVCLFPATERSHDRGDVRPKTLMHKPDDVGTARKGTHHKHFILITEFILNKWIWICVESEWWLKPWHPGQFCVSFNCQLIAFTQNTGATNFIPIIYVNITKRNQTELVQHWRGLIFNKLIYVLTLV